MRKNSILIVEDDPDLGRTLFEGLAKEGNVIHLAQSAEEALRLFVQKAFDLVISDVKLPDLDGLQLLESIKKAFEYLLKPFSLNIMDQVVEKALENNSVKQEVNLEPLDLSAFSMPIVTKDRKMLEILELCKRVAPTKATLLIQGESGTGKELFARFVHRHSQRNQGFYVAVNCASLPESLLESELFGHEKGAFTGAVGKKLGKFELAHRGTILLDEISEMNTLLQAKILRVLQENEVDRIGGRQPIPVDIRVIATTNRNLETCIEKGEFREDLYYRLNVISMKLPPLRERTDDIELLAQYFLKQFAEIHGKPMHSLSENALSWLKKQEWRGNVRELKNTIERAVLISSERVLTLQDFGSEELVNPEENLAEDSSTLSLRNMEKKLIFRALEKTNGNRTHAAKILGISIRTLRNKLSEYKQGLSPQEAV
ncbi:MAG: sigma-54 dependent transcriptional regulator [Thermodesulfobacteriota bacterium]